MVRFRFTMQKRIAAILLGIACFSTGIRAQDIEDEPPFEWDATFASPGTSLALEETNRLPRTDSGQSIFYRVQSNGFSPGESVSLWLKGGSRYFSFPATVDDQGVIQIDAGEHVLGAVLVLAFVRDEGISIMVPGGGGPKALLLAGFAEGHPLNMAVVSEGSGNRAQAKVVPIPLRAEGNAGCSAEAELQSETGLLFLITFRGFRPEEVVRIDSRYERDEISSTISASETGEVAFPVLFERRDRGEAAATATTDACTVTLEYNVGADALVR